MFLRGRACKQPAVHCGKPPTEGLKLALKIITLQANHSDWAIKTFGNAPADAAKDPAAAMDNQFKIEAAIDAAAAARAKTSDANSLIYLAKANQLANADPTKIKAPALILYSPTDLVFYRPLVEEAAKKIASGGTPVDTAQLPGPNGHLNGVFGVAQQGEKIKAFLDK